MKERTPKNGVELMHQVFASICETSPVRRVTEVAGGDLVVHLQTGSNEGQAARLCYEKREPRLQFYTYLKSALRIEHQDEAVFSIQMCLRSTEVHDPKCGRMFQSHFHLKPIDLLRLGASRCKWLSFLASFLPKLDELPCEYMWECEVNAEIEKGRQQLIEAHQKGLEVCTE